jgi:hypothetical protein
MWPTIIHWCVQSTLQIGLVKGSASLLAKLDDTVAGRESKEPITWFDELNHAFLNAHKALHDNCSITLPQSNDQLWIVTETRIRSNFMR